ncbi:hypothetical protein ACFRSX_00200 [Streptomyces goshikiensis]|uniref:hypothetical protein n=1 Tax=Streptomyces TaxID=1883 RepID=UPI000C27713C|nr:hypothetical protein [Streptomyces sp. CB02120-2]PJN17787.1 hypothetical protein CG724_14435 [Streptomyces sp. CB02120-2]
MTAEPPLSPRLRELLRAGAAELEERLAETTDLDWRVSAALAGGSAEGDSTSRLDSLLLVGGADLRRVLAESTDVEQKLSESVARATAKGKTKRPGRPGSTSFIEHHTA